jgi:hypothetical protein
MPESLPAKTEVKAKDDLDAGVGAVGVELVDYPEAEFFEVRFEDVDIAAGLVDRGAVEKGAERTLGSIGGGE